MDKQSTPPHPPAKSDLPPDKAKGPRLVDVVVSDENTALNVMLGFLTVAQQKGAYNLEESAKIWECIKIFQKPGTN